MRSPYCEAGGRGAAGGGPAARMGSGFASLEVVVWRHWKETVGLRGGWRVVDLGGARANDGRSRGILYEDIHLRIKRMHVQDCR